MDCISVRPFIKGDVLVTRVRILLGQVCGGCVSRHGLIIVAGGVYLYRIK